jgi:hypothetical protein
MAQNHDVDPTFVAANIAFIGQKPAMTGLLLAAIIKKSNRYRYKVTRTDNKGCSITFYEKYGNTWEEIGVSDFVESDAQAAGLVNGSNQNWRKYPKAMYFWRAMSQGARMYAPDALAGMCCHLIEEVAPETDVDEDGVPVVDAIVVERKPLTEATLKEIESEIARTGAPLDKVLAYYGVTQIKDLDESDGEELVKRLSVRPTVSQPTVAPEPELAPTVKTPAKKKKTLEDEEVVV